MKTNRFIVFGLLLAALLIHSAVVCAQQPMRVKTWSKYEFGGVFGPPDFGRRDTLTYEYGAGRQYNKARQKWYYDKAIYHGKDIDFKPYVVAKDSVTIDNNGNPIVSFQRNIPNDTAQIILYSYTSNNQPKTEYCWYMAWGSNATKIWDTLYYYRYAYDGSGKLASEIIANYSFNFKEWTIDSNAYSYDGSTKTGYMTYRLDNRFTPPAYKLQDKYTYRYINGLIDTLLKETIDNIDLEPKKLITYHYSSNGDLDTITSYLWNRFDIEWSIDERDCYLFDNNHNAIKHVRQAASGGRWINKLMDSTIYNSANLPVVETRNMKWDNDSAKFVNYQSFYTPTTKHYYFYEFATSVDDLVQEKNDLKIYPNPAYTSMTIQLQNKGDYPMNFMISDMNGKIVRHWTEAPARHYSKIIDVSDLPTGQYILRTSGDKLNHQRFTILRLR